MIEKLDIFQHLNFEPIFFLKSGGEIVSYLEYREFCEKEEFIEYYKHYFEMDYNDKLITYEMLILSYTYFYFFDEFYLGNEQFKKNKLYIESKLLRYDGFKDIFNLIKQQPNLSKKWFNIISKVSEMEDNIDKVLIVETIKGSFVHEYINFISWFKKVLEEITLYKIKII